MKIRGSIHGKAVVQDVQNLVEATLNSTTVDGCGEQAREVAVIRQGKVPIVPNLLALNLNPSDPDQVEFGWQAAQVLIHKCDEMMQFIVDGIVSEGMEWEREWWKENRSGRPLTFLNLDSEHFAT